MKITSDLTEALSGITSGNSVFIHGGAATPGELIKGLVGEAARLNNVEILHLHTEGDVAYAAPAFHQSFSVTNLFVGQNMRPYLDYDHIDYLPCFLSEIPKLIRSDVKKIYVALIQVSPPDKHGHVSLGVSVDVAKAAVDKANLVIAQINRNMPRVHGDGFIHIDKISYAIEQHSSLYSPALKKISLIEQTIGKNVASLIEDGATLQFGIGNIPDAVCQELLHHQNLGLHSEMWSDGAYHLIKKGVINNSQKRIHRVKVTSVFIIGSPELYRFIDDNNCILNLEADYINNPLTIIRNPKISAINSAVEIDLTGQICADSVGSKIISGVGGQMDFMRAAALSEGGKAILAFTSTTKHGLSRIRCLMRPGAGVVTTRSHVHYVVTEYEIVNLYGKTLGQRARALINLPHPSIREQLEREWRELKQF